MVFEYDIDIQKIVLKYFKKIKKSKNKERTIKQIVDDIKKKYPSEKQPLIISELRRRLIALSLNCGYIYSPKRSPKRSLKLSLKLSLKRSPKRSYIRIFKQHHTYNYSSKSNRDSKKRPLYSIYKVKAQANEEYIKYVELLDELTKE